MQFTQSIAEKRLSELGIKDMPVIAVSPTPQMVSPDWFKKYKELSKNFMQSLSDSVQELAFMNLSQDEFMNLLMGRAVPENLSLRFRVPLSWGGKLEIDNLFMCRTFPHSQNMDRFIIEQNGAKTIWLPNPAKKIYLPVNTSTGGTGGNATDDRLTQMASMMSSNSMG